MGYVWKKRGTNARFYIENKAEADADTQTRMGQNESWLINTWRKEMWTGSNGAAPDISHLNCRYSEKSFVCVRSICVIISALCTVRASSIRRPVRRDC